MFWGPCTPFSIVATPIYTSPAVHRGSLSPQPHQQLLTLVFWITSIPRGVVWHLWWLWLAFLWWLVMVSIFHVLGHLNVFFRKMSITALGLFSIDHKHFCTVALGMFFCAFQNNMKNKCYLLDKAVVSKVCYVRWSTVGSEENRRMSVSVFIYKKGKKRPLTYNRISLVPWLLCFVRQSRVNYITQEKRGAPGQGSGWCSHLLGQGQMLPV